MSPVKNMFRPIRVSLILSILILAGCHQRAIVKELPPGDEQNMYVPTVFLDEGAVTKLPKPTFLFGVSGFSVTLLRREDARIPRTTIQLPELPKPKAPMILYFKVPHGMGDEIKASGGTAEIIWQGNGHSIGGMVRIEDLTNMIVGSSDDMLYSYEMVSSVSRMGSGWKPRTVTVSFMPEDESMSFPIEVLIECGGVK